MSKTNPDTVYDVVIVGGGIAGAILAKTLVNAGKNVLILEAGDGVTPSRRYPTVWNWTLRPSR